MTILFVFLVSHKVSKAWSIKCFKLIVLLQLNLSHFHYSKNLKIPIEYGKGLTYMESDAGNRKGIIKVEDVALQSLKLTSCRGGGSGSPLPEQVRKTVAQGGGVLPSPPHHIHTQSAEGKRLSRGISYIHPGYTRPLVYGYRSHFNLTQSQEY